MYENNLSVSQNYKQRRSYMGLFNWLFGKPEVFEVVDDSPPQAEHKWRRPKGAVQVWAWCRANKVHGREIYCPKCNAPSTVYNFAWYSLKCHNCEKTVPAAGWYTVRTDKELKRQIAQAEAKAGGKK